MLKFPCPIEKELDKIRDKMWQRANRKPERLFQMIREEAKEIEEKYQLAGRVRKTR